MSKGDFSVIPEDVPNIAILGAGGGLRAMIALHGTLQELQKHGLLDTIMYLCGVSGATWCMSSLYNNGDWAEKLQALEKHMCDALTKSSWNLRKATEMLLEAAKDENYSLTDFWAYIVVYGINWGGSWTLGSSPVINIKGRVTTLMYEVASSTSWPEVQNPLTCKGLISSINLVGT
uniref:PLA2c domain-containing protein n=1 Tax=Chelydra serpentina TaxID=8475 RepID=A0A8C3XPB1_CHESE